MHNLLELNKKRAELVAYLATEKNPRFKDFYQAARRELKAVERAMNKLMAEVA